MPASRQAIAVTAARLPPALSPATPTRLLVAAEFGDAGDDVLCRRKGVLERAGKPHLGRAAIIDGDDDRAGLDRKPARLPVMGVEIAGDPAAAVEEHDRRRFLARVPVGPRVEEPGGAFHLDVLRAHHRRRRDRRARGRQRAQRIARALRRHRRGIAQRQQRNDLGDDGIERWDHAESASLRNKAAA